MKPRASSHLAVWAVGLAALFGLRYLPPDTSLDRVQRSGTLTVCHPASLPPYVTYHPDEARADGLEAERVMGIARALGVRVQWNPQVNWYVTRDPTAWGVRKGSCDVLAGGIAATDASRGLLVLSKPYLRVSWAMIARRAPREGDRVALWVPYLGLDRVRMRATELLTARGFQPYFPGSAEQAARALAGHEVVALLTDEPTARWVAQQLAGHVPLFVAPEPALGTFQLALGFWKGDVTLERAVNRALESALGQAGEETPGDAGGQFGSAPQ
ncbi:transporter substrate-binding domain-containing protein [Carboxydochorda subterranea]|uniref:Transporter substrate-binding domain-containing protein n=1 Tax=Carboxydichorda subterranea TaxID=3109565 RepID=A0ABZ1BUF0_9FIRM|nr:transporter substrate-binding domain-containing protein [Limnochorda sp. L945t]WRP16156.1 transporter substrate-binding domain-containing protein [Limnochorda sp. L945t]